MRIHEISGPGTDCGFSKVSKEGDGNSFDGTVFDGKNRMMGVLNRQSRLTDSERHVLDNILADRECQELGRRIALATQG